jgi:hypothetical protein
MQCILKSFPWQLRVLDSGLLSCDYLQTTFVVPYKPSARTAQAKHFLLLYKCLPLLPSTKHGADHTENTSHVIPTQRVHWRADCCLAMSYNIRPIVACAYRGMFIEPISGNALTCHNMKRTYALCVVKEQINKEYYFRNFKIVVGYSVIEISNYKHIT